VKSRANEGKSLEIDIDGVRYERIPIRTHVVMSGDDVIKVIKDYAAEAVRPGDVLFVTEKIVAISQGRSYPLESISVRPLARMLSNHVLKTPHGIGLGMPETMEMALRECGVPRILFAAAVSVVSKRLGRSGDFYRIAGPKARGIDGPTPKTIPPYNQQVVLTPARPTEMAGRIKRALGDVCDVLIVDINDFGGNVLGSTVPRKTHPLYARILRDNPLGQEHQSTPLGIIRVVR
jgi:F420-0:gamma-glutamyl ligase